LSNSKREEIKQQILQWLSQEKQWQVVVSKEEDRKISDYYYFFCKVILSGDMNCDVGIEKDVDRVNIMVNPVIAQPDASSYKLSPKPDKYMFWIQVRISLAQMGVNVVAIPNVDDLASLQVNKPIYFDGWSQDKFVEAMLKVTDAVEVAELYFKTFAQDMRQRGQKQE
jgi:hypothetical protein